MYGRQGRSLKEGEIKMSEEATKNGKRSLRRVWNGKDTATAT